MRSVKILLATKEKIIYPEKEIGKMLGIKPIKKLEFLLFSHINEFTLDELVEYATKLFAPFHLEITPEKSLLFSRKTVNDRLKK